MRSLDNPEFRLAVEVLYHGSRQAFLAGAHRWAMFATIIFGASAAAALAPIACGLLAAASGAADIAFDFTGRAQAHADKRRAYLELVPQMAGDPEGFALRFASAWTVISADEPPLYRWAEAIAHRNACISLGQPVPAALPLYQRLFAHVIRG